MFGGASLVAPRRVAAGLAVAGVLGAVGGLASTASADGLAAPRAVTAGDVSASGPSVPDGPAMCGDTISSPGNYWLLADCSGSGIDINASNVTLYLNGHTMTGPGASADTVGVFVDDRGSAISGVRIKGPGSVTGYTFDIDLGVFGAFGVSNSAVGLVATPGGDQGITMSDAAGGGNVITGNANNGDRFGIGDFGTGNQIGQNTTDGNSGAGIDVLGSGDTISNNTAQGNAVDLRDQNPGCDSNVWRNNHFTTSNQSCIH